MSAKKIMKDWENFDNELKGENNVILKIVDSIIRKWYLFVISILLCCGLAIFYLKYTTPIYVVSAKVLVSDEKKGAGMMQNSMLGDLTGMLGGKSTVDNEAEVLRTRNLMEQVVRTLNSNITYFKTGGLRDIELYESPYLIRPIKLVDSLENISFDLEALPNMEVRVSGEQFNHILKSGSIFTLPDVGDLIVERNTEVPLETNNFRIAITTIDTKVAQFMDQLSIKVPNKLVTVIDLSFKYPVKKKGEEILNTLIRKYVENSLQDKNTIADSTIAFIEDRLRIVGQELGEVEGEIQNFKQNSEIADIGTQSQLLIQNSSDYVQELSEVETQISILDGMYKYLSDANTPRVLPSSLIPQDGVFNNLVQRYNMLLMDLDRQLLSSTKDNPYVVNLEEQIKNLRSDMLRNLESTKSNLLVSRNELINKTGRIGGEIRKVPAIERTYLDLTRQQQIKQELFVFLLQKREETAIGKTSNISDSRIIDSPKASNIAVSPKKVLVISVGLFIGLLLPLILIYLNELFNIRVSNKLDVTSRCNAPIIGEISESETADTVVVSHNSRNVNSEQFRSLRTNLSFYLKDPNQKVVLLTSSMSGEGKSFTALNLSMALAISGKKVVLMEMDLRKPKLSSNLAIPNIFGFTNYIIDSTVEASSLPVNSGTHENLFIINSGPIPPNPSELILDSRTDLLIERLSSSFDYVIVDAPPIGLVTDAQILSKFSDLTIYIVRQDYTYKDQMGIINSLYQERKMGEMAVLINGVKYGKGYGYGSSYGYGYDGGYYSDSKQDRARWWQFKSDREKRGRA